jgi:DNA-binding CsgD family transcriptional regulator
MTAPETAVALGISESTVNRGMRSAKSWLFREISESR